MFSSNKTPTILLIASRTGGPLIPLLALKDDLIMSNPNLNFIIVGIKGGVEEKLAKQEGIKLVYLPEVKRVYHSNKLQNLVLLIWTMIRLSHSWLLSIIIILKYKPKLILSTSNFLSVPIIWATAFANLFKSKNSKTKIAIHLLDPQNQTIKLTKNFADLLTTGFESIAKKLGSNAKVVPSPVRHALFDKYTQLEAKNKMVELELISHQSAQKPIFLIFGGGSGAEFINDWVEQNAEEICKYCTVFHLTGFLREKKVRKSQIQDFYQLEGLTDLMPLVLVASDAVMARAGMSSISELLYLKKPAFLIPIPESHQEQNAALVQNYFQVLNQKDVDQWSGIIQNQFLTKFEYTKNVVWDQYPDKNNQKYISWLLDLLK